MLPGLSQPSAAFLQVPLIQWVLFNDRTLHTVCKNTTIKSLQNVRNTSLWGQSSFVLRTASSAGIAVLQLRERTQVGICSICWIKNSTRSIRLPETLALWFGIKFSPREKPFKNANINTGMNLLGGSFYPLKITHKCAVSENGKKKISFENPRGKLIHPLMPGELCILKQRRSIKRFLC